MTEKELLEQAISAAIRMHSGDPSEQHVYGDDADRVLGYLRALKDRLTAVPGTADGRGVGWQGMESAPKDGGGGWVWNGICGQMTYWPKIAPPTALPTASAEMEKGEVAVGREELADSFRLASLRGMTLPSWDELNPDEKEPWLWGIDAVLSRLHSPSTAKEPT